MKHEIRNKPDFAALVCWLDEGEKLVTETGAMMGMDPGLTMETNMQGGLFGALKRAVGGESVFLNTYTSTGPAQRIDVAPSMPGDMVHVNLNNSAVMVQSGSYCACTEGVEIDTKWGGAKSFFGGEGLFMLKCHGTGELWMSSYGAIHEVQVNQRYVVDTTHIVAFDESLTFHVRTLGDLKSRLLGGEGRVCEFTGNGRVWFQTRSAPTLAEFLHPFRRLKPSND